MNAIANATLVIYDHIHISYHIHDCIHRNIHDHIHHRIHNHNRIFILVFITHLFPIRFQFIIDSLPIVGKEYHGHESLYQFIVRAYEGY